MEPANAPVVPPRSAVNQLMGLYVIVSFFLALAWLLGSFDCSFLWIFGIISALFVVWKTRLRDLVEHTLDWHKDNFHRKRALRQEETAEWLNFIINRWWVFSSLSIEDLVKRRITDRLLTVKPSFISDMQLIGFTFGDITPNLRCIKAFECSDGVPGFKPASWSSVLHPPAGLHKMSTFQIVLESDIAAHCSDFKMIFRARIGGPKVGLNFDVAVEELQIKGTLQVVLHMSVDVPFPHVTKASVSFTDMPEVWFNVTVMKAIQLMEIPMLKSWIHINVMEGITKALVDPGKIDIPVALPGPVNYHQYLPHNKSKLAQGVLTVIVRGMPSPNAGEDIHYTRLRLGKCKRQTQELPATNMWEDCCSFFVHDLCNEKVNIKHKCKRLLTTVTLQQHDLELSSFPFQITKQINHVIDNNDGSRLNLVLDYSPLSPINLEEKEPTCVLQHAGVLYVCIHCANNVIISDKSGSSDPYCVVFCDRRRVLTTPYVAQTRNPSWESQTEFFVKDFSQCQLSFYVFDWDGTNTLNDDFLGSANLHISEKEPYLLKKTLLLGYNKQGEGHVQDYTLGQIVVSVIFRPVPSVAKSERHRLMSQDSVNNNNEILYMEDMHVSPGTSSNKKKKNRNSLISRDEEFMKDKIFVDLTIIQARDLISMDSNGYSDPFCEVRMGNVKLFSTSVKKRTLYPKWNESVTLQVNEDCGMLEIQLFDKDLITSNDFLGKVMLTLDQLKELSLRATSDWFVLQHAKSGEIQMKCAVTAADTLRKESSLPESDIPEELSRHVRSELSNKPPSRETSMENDVFTTVLEAPKANSTITPPRNGSLKGEAGTDGHRWDPVTSTPNDAKERIRRSESDVNLERRRSHTNSLNSLPAFNGLDVSAVTEHSSLYSIADADYIAGSMDSLCSAGDGAADRLFNVKGKILGLQGLKITEGNIYCKVRVISPNRHRLRQIFGNRVIAKSTMVKATLNPVFDLPIDVDRGIGISGDTRLKFDIKREGKEHLATKEYTIKSLFSGPGGEGDKVQKVLPLENHLQVEVYLQHSPVDASQFVRRRHSGRFRSFRQ